MKKIASHRYAISVDIYIVNGDSLEYGTQKSL